VIPVGARDDRPDYDYADGVTLRAYELAEGQRVRVSIPALTGEERCAFTVVRHGERVAVEQLGPPSLWQLGDGGPTRVTAG
jgi:alpha-D-xyloside xylohydrolase